jgi:Flp pilus assembly pilin Flp
MSEYIIILALIAVAAIGIYSMFGKTIRGQVAGTAADDGKATAASAATAAAAASRASADKGISSYDAGNK